MTILIMGINIIYVYRNFIYIYLYGLNILIASPLQGGLLEKSWERAKWGNPLKNTKYPRLSIFCGTLGSLELGAKGLR